MIRLYKAKKKHSDEWIEGYLIKAKWYYDESEMFVILPTDICIYPHCEFSEWYEIDENTISFIENHEFQMNKEKIFLERTNPDQIYLRISEDNFKDLCNLPCCEIKEALMRELKKMQEGER